MPDSHLKNRSSRRKRTVLVVEDELINREILGFLIQDEFEALFAENGAQAMEIIEAGYATLSLILLDLNLPDMKGQEILRRVKEDVRTALLPVIVMTADSDAEVECLHMGATDFIPKPYPDPDVVLARVRRIVELKEDRKIAENEENPEEVKENFEGFAKGEPYAVQQSQGKRYARAMGAPANGRGDA